MRDDPVISDGQWIYVISIKQLCGARMKYSIVLSVSGKRQGFVYYIQSIVSLLVRYIDDFILHFSF